VALACTSWKEVLYSRPPQLAVSARFLPPECLPWLKRAVACLHMAPPSWGQCPVKQLAAGGLPFQCAIEKWNLEWTVGHCPSAVPKAAEALRQLQQVQQESNNSAGAAPASAPGPWAPGKAPGERLIKSAIIATIKWLDQGGAKLLSTTITFPMSDSNEPMLTSPSAPPLLDGLQVWAGLSQSCMPHSARHMRHATCCWTDCSAALNSRS
jgi:hypothetical protein